MDPLAITEEKSDPAAVIPAQIPPICEWLQFVDNMIARRDIPLMKLCLYPTFKSWKKGSEAVDIQQIFRAMKNSDDPDCQEDVLYKFICALRVVGGQWRGNMCVAELESKGINVPKFENHEESKDFHFFQCFARVAREVESNYSDQQKLKEACGRRLKKNHRDYNYLADMFKEMYEAQKVTPEDYTEFYEMLERCEDGAEYTKIMDKYSTLSGMLSTYRLHDSDHCISYWWKHALYEQDCMSPETFHV